MNRMKTAISCLCIITAIVFAQQLFTGSTLLPIFWSLVCLVPLVWLRRSWLRWAMIIPLVAVVLLVGDAYFLRHRLAVAWRVWDPMFDTTDVSEVLVSPSGRTTVYLLNTGFTDSSYSVCVSGGTLFPIFGYLVPTSEDMFRRDLDIGWRGSVFTAGHRLLSFGYSEPDRKVLTYEDWIRGPIPSGDPPKTIEAFSAQLAGFRH